MPRYNSDLSHTRHRQYCQSCICYFWSLQRVGREVIKAGKRGKKGSQMPSSQQYIAIIIMKLGRLLHCTGPKMSPLTTKNGWKRDSGGPDSHCWTISCGYIQWNGKSLSTALFTQIALINGNRSYDKWTVMNLWKEQLDLVGLEGR